MPVLDLGEYLPDLAPLGNPGLIQAGNCLPYGTHYRSMKSLVPYGSNGLSNPARGFISVRDKSGNAYSYAGDISKLYRLSSSTWYDASASSTTYAVASTDMWEFAKWGETIIGTDYTDVIQTITFGQSNFAALAGTPPKARHLAVVKDFLVLGNVTDFSSGAAVPNRVHWSGFNNVATWAPSASTQADFQDLYGDAGWIQKVIGGEFGLIFQERSITRMTFVGSPLIFQFDEVEPGRGTPAANSIIRVGGTVFYLGQDDFYATTGGPSTGIAGNRIYQTFSDSFNNSLYNKVIAGADPNKPFVFWAYPDKTSTGNPNKILVYNYAVNKWAGPIDISIETFGSFQAEGYTMETLDNVSTNLDSFTESLDSRSWMGGVLNLVAFDTNHKLNTFTGNDLTATFETGDRQIYEKNRALVSSVTPLVEGASASVSVAISGRNLLSQPANYTSDVVMNADGECPLFSEGRYHRLKMKVSGGFTHAQGFNVDSSKEGRY